MPYPAHPSLKPAHGGGADLLVCSRHNRKLTADESAEQESWQHVESLPVAARIKVAVPRSAGKSARTARLKLRYAKVELNAPAH